MEKSTMLAFVFVLHQFQVGGVESVFLNLVNQLPNQKFYLITVRDDINPELERQLPNHVEFLDRGNTQITVQGVFFQAKRIKKKIEIDTVEVKYYINFSDNLSSLLLMNLIGINDIRVSWCHCNPEWLKKSRSYFLYKNLLKNCHTIVAVCDQQKDSLIQLIPSIEHKIKVISNLLNVPLIDDKLHQPIDIVPKDYILMVARFDKKSKDFETLIQAYAKLSNELRKKHPLVLVGDGNDLATIKNYVSTLDLDKAVIFVGNSHNPYQWMKNCEVFVLSSKTEGFSMVILEALYCQAPVIASNCPVGPSDLLKGGQYGKLFNVGDSHKLSELLQSFLQNQAINHHYRILAKSRALEVQQQGMIALQQFFS